MSLESEHRYSAVQASSTLGSNVPKVNGLHLSHEPSAVIESLTAAVSAPPPPSFYYSGPQAASDFRFIATPNALTGDGDHFRGIS